MKKLLMALMSTVMLLSTAACSSESATPTTFTDGLLTFTDISGYDTDTDYADTLGVSDALASYYKSKLLGGDYSLIVVYTVSDYPASVLTNESFAETLVSTFSSEFESDNMSSTSLTIGEFDVVDISGTDTSDSTDRERRVTFLSAGGTIYVVEGQSTGSLSDQMSTDIDTFIENIEITGEAAADTGDAVTLDDGTVITYATMEGYEHHDYYAETMEISNAIASYGIITADGMTSAILYSNSEYYSIISDDSYDEALASNFSDNLGGEITATRVTLGSLEALQLAGSFIYEDESYSICYLYIPFNETVYIFQGQTPGASGDQLISDMHTFVENMTISQ